MEGIELTMIGSHDAPNIWPLVLPLIREFEHRLLPYAKISQIYQLIMQDKMQLMVGHRGSTIFAAGVSEVLSYPNVKVGRLVGVAGAPLEDVVDLMPLYEKWAEGEDCELVEVSGRRGWTRALKDSGFTETSTIVLKRINMSRLN